MVIGEVDENDFRESSLAKILYISFLFIVVILLANVLAFIIGSSVVDTRKGRSYFWMNRLRYIMSMDTIRSSRAVSGPFGWLENTTPEDYGRKYWESLISVFDQDESNWWKLSLAILHLVLTVPLWIVAGLVTWGLLFPPQLREWVVFSALNSKVDDIHYDGPSADILATMKEENALLKKEMKAVKKEAKADMKSLEKKVDVMLSLLQEKHTK